METTIETKREAEATMVPPSAVEVWVLVKVFTLVLVWVEAADVVEEVNVEVVEVEEVEVDVVAVEEVDVVTTPPGRT